MSIWLFHRSPRILLTRVPIMPNHHHQAEAWSSQCPMIKMSIMLTPITLTGYHHLSVRLSKVPQHHLSSELNLCWAGLWHLSLELNLCWPWLQTAWSVTHAWHVKFPIGIWSTVINFILSSFPMLMCYVISLENMISFRRLYLICQDTCSMKPIFLVIVVTFLPHEQFQCT